MREEETTALRWTAAEIAEACGGAILCGRADAAVESVSIDSRSLPPGAVFFAIEGPRHDGHRFVDDAFARGAAGVVVRRAVTVPPGGFAIRVEDTTMALQDLAAAARRRSAVRLVAITGSMGKTTTKEAAAAALAARYRVLKSPGNLNNLYGLPLSLLALDDEEVAVVELGMSAPGEIRRLTRIARPDVGVLTNVAEVHREFFPSLEAIAEAKGELFDELEPGSVGVVNADDPLVLEQARRFAGRTLRFGFGPASDLRALELRRTDAGTAFVATDGERTVEVRSSLYGRHNVYNLLAALAAAKALGVPLDEAAAALARLRPAPQRGERIALAGGALVLDESYNSSPSALLAALDVLAEEPAERRIAVLGDMLELGDRADALHRECGRKAARVVDLLVGVGPLARVLVEAAREAGLAAEQTWAVDDAEEAAALLGDRLRRGDVVLLKGSRRVALERVLERWRRAAGEGGR